MIYKYKRAQARYLKNFGKPRSKAEYKSEPTKKKSKVGSFLRNSFIFIILIIAGLAGGLYLSKNSHEVVRFVTSNSSQYLGEFLGNYINKYAVFLVSKFEITSEKEVNFSIDRVRSEIQSNPIITEENVARLIEEKINKFEIDLNTNKIITDIENLNDSLNNIRKKIENKNKNDNLDLFKKRVASLEDSFLYFGSSQKTELSVLSDVVSSIQENISSINDKKKSNKSLQEDNNKIKKEFESLQDSVQKIEFFNKNFYSRLNILISVLRLRNFENDNEKLRKATELLALSVSKLNEPVALGKIANLLSIINKNPPTRAELYKKFPLVIRELNTLSEKKDTNTWYSGVKRNLKSIVQVRHTKNPAKGSMGEKILNLENAVSSDNLDYAISILNSLDIPDNFFTSKWIDSSTSRLQIEKSLDLLEREVVAIVIEK